MSIPSKNAENNDADVVSKMLDMAAAFAKKSVRLIILFLSTIISIFNSMICFLYSFIISPVGEILKSVFSVKQQI